MRFKRLAVILQIAITSAIARLFKAMNYMRKYAFFTRETAVLYYKNHNSWAAHSLLQLIAKYYQLNGIEEKHSAISQRGNFCQPYY